MVKSEQVILIDLYMVSDFMALCIMEDKIDVSEDGISEEVETLVIVFVTDTDGEVRTSDSD